MTLDVAVIGAGLAGLACAQRLQQLGLRVGVVEKSRGLGGRLATRRLAGTQADHGARYLEDQGRLTQTLIQILCERGILHVWTDTIYELNRSGTLQPFPLVHPRYAAIDGITAVAKFLGSGLEIWRSQRVAAITPQTDRTWALTLEPNSPSPHPPVPINPHPALTARAIVIAIPAPQALALLHSLSDQGLSAEVLAGLRSVRFDPCLTTIASYTAAQQADVVNLLWQAVIFAEQPDLAWIALDSTKQRHPQQPAVILQSTATFAQTYLEQSDLQSVGQQLVDRAAQLLQPWLAEPETLQVHRWRYAFASRPIPATHLSSLSPLPLVCGGDWCGGSTIEAALQSGLQSAATMAEYLNQSPGSEPLETSWQTILKQISLNL